MLAIRIRSFVFVFPVHAGMFRLPSALMPLSVSFPRTRGDVPFWLEHIRPFLEFSPYTRGCSGGVIYMFASWLVFPVHAGMFRSVARPARLSPSFPRTRGDVPIPLGRLEPAWWFSPYTRGCSVLEWIKRLAEQVFPVHAGMFRTPPPFKE